jgi:hypothetical protein
VKRAGPFCLDELQFGGIERRIRVEPNYAWDGHDCPDESDRRYTLLFQRSGDGDGVLGGDP